MSITAVVEFAVQVEQFRNLDLVHQGLYRIGLTIEGAEGFQVLPFNIISSREQVKGESIEGLNSHCLIPSRLDTNTYLTQTFYIKFQEEEVTINEIVRFSAKVPIAWFESGSPLKLNADLIFGD